MLVGLMGAGKTTVGRLLASRLKLPFIDADDEIEKAAGCSIPEIFERLGEKGFRDGERRVMTRLLNGKECVLATGGGAFMAPETRAEIKRHGLSVWLRADLDLLMDRVSRRRNRPLLNNQNPRETMAHLIEERYPIYQQADITVDSGEERHETVVEKIVKAISEHKEQETN